MVTSRQAIVTSGVLSVCITVFLLEPYIFSVAGVLLRGPLGRSSKSGKAGGLVSVIFGIIVIVFQL